jgi:hypothetical protein
MTIVMGAFFLVLGIIIGHFSITKTSTTIDRSWKYDHLMQQADLQNYQTFIDSIKAANIEANLK